MAEALFGSYNARFIDFQTVGERFVMRESAFKLLSEHNNALLLGPRGSGKTTLLKMLKIGAQIRASQKFHKIFKEIKYTPVYVGADRQFELLVRGITDGGESLPKLLEGLLHSLMAIRAQFALLDTLKEITDPATENVAAVSHQYVPMSRHQEQQFCILLNRSWRLDSDAQNVMELRAELWSRIQRINAAITDIRVNGSAAGQLDDSLNFDTLTSVGSFVDAFESSVERRTRMWCLCVDELEIMPENIQDYFYLSLRSTDQRLLLKLATSPYTPSFDIAEPGAAPMHGHDYTVINLTDRSRSESNRFVRQLVGKLLSAEELPTGATPELLLGRSPITDEGNAGEVNSAYKSPSGAHYKRFRELYNVDPAFRRYLDARDIDIERLNDMDERSRAASARKIIWPVALRLVYGSHQAFKFGGNVGFRSSSNKRTPPMYTGSDAVISMCEGNPRVTIGLFRDLIAAFRRNQNKRVPTHVQSQIVESAIDKFLSLLSAIPAPLNQPRGNTSVLELLQKIGDYIQARNFGTEFSPELIGTFVVDGNINGRLRRAIGQAVNQGAFVMVENAMGDASFGGLSGARLRLSYLLCPYFRLPLTVSGRVNLSTALSEAPNKLPSRPPTMEDLFGPLN
ncbi:hypothetical protein NKI74_33140 [Mesorhizobium sp. M0494]|uniref:ORC-CDC6 family AAA ATPase n=1 Tax=Mesorhizobium sp. M0494 TaxID=2956951 RepID=UPI003337365E